MVGGSFTALTVTTTASLAVNVPSLTVRMMVAAPLWLAAGVIVTVRLAPLPPNTMFPLGTNVGLDEPPLTARLPGAVWASPTVKLSAPVVPSSLIVWSGTSETVGGVFTPLTVRTKTSAALREPSLTVTVMVALPTWPGAGVTVTVRLLPLPPNTMLPLGTSVGLDELPLRVRLATGVSASLTVKPIAGVGVPTAVDWSEISLMVGACAPLETVVNVRVQLPSVPWSPGPSSTRYNDQTPFPVWPLNTF